MVLCRRHCRRNFFDHPRHLPAPSAALAIGSKYNKSDAAMWLKIAACFLTVFVFWDLKFGEQGRQLSGDGSQL